MSYNPTKWLDRALEWELLSRETTDPWIKSVCVSNGDMCQTMATFFKEKY